MHKNRLILTVLCLATAPRTISAQVAPVSDEAARVKLTQVMPTQTRCENIPIGNFDGTFICQVSPDLIDLQTLQTGNTHPMVKIKPKKSWELRNNYIGGTTTRLPRSREFDFTPAAAIHLIDNDPQSFWVCNTGEMSQISPWCRIQLAKESTITAIELLPLSAPRKYEQYQHIGYRQAGAGFPRRLEVQSTRDGVNWKTIYQSEGPADTKDATAALCLGLQSGQLPAAASTAP